MIGDEVGGGKLPRTQPVLWGDLRPGDVITCPWDGFGEEVYGSEPGRPGEWRVGVRDETGEAHIHVRPASDVAPADPRGEG